MFLYLVDGHALYLPNEITLIFCKNKTKQNKTNIQTTKIVCIVSASLFLDFFLDLLFVVWGEEEMLIILR